MAAGMAGFVLHASVWSNPPSPLAEGAGGQGRRNAVWETEKGEETVCGKFKKQ